jgi:RimJ/RimL family protein N-acetyltransferase
MGSDDRVAVSTPSMRIEVEELVIRPYRPDDARELMEAVSDSIEHLRPWMPWIQFEPQDIYDKRTLIKSFSEEWESRTGFTMGIFLGDRVVGGTGFHVRGPNDSLEIGYWVRTGHTRQRIAARCAAALTDEAFQHSEIDRVFINHDEANIASEGVPLSLGFSLFAREPREALTSGDSGVMKRWVMTREAWLLKKQDQ